LHHARGLTAEHMDKRLAGHATDEGIDHVSVGDVGELVALLGEALDVLLEGLIGPLPIVRRSHEFLGQMYMPWKCSTKTEQRSPQQLMLPGSSCSSHALVELDRSRGRY
jgi:hypothetical protein